MTSTHGYGPEPPPPDGPDELGPPGGAETPAPPTVPGVTLGGWPGDAGTGEVWAATLDDDATPCVVRLIRLPADPVRRGRAASAGRRLIQLSHAHLVPVLAVEEVDDGLAVVMARVPEAVSLRRLLAARDRLEPGEVVTVGLPVAQALAATHEAGLAHGTLTPADILLEPNGRPQLAGIGVAALRALAAGGPAPTAAGDVYDLADLLLDTMARATGPDAAAVAVAVATALVPDPARRPTAAELASALAHSARPAPVQMIDPPPPVPPPDEELRPRGGDGILATDDAQARATEAEPGDPGREGGHDEDEDDGYDRYGGGAVHETFGTGTGGEDDDVVDAVIIGPSVMDDEPAADGTVVEGAVVDPEVDVLPILPRPEPPGPRHPRPPGSAPPIREGRPRGRAPRPFPGGRPTDGSTPGAGRGPATAPRGGGPGTAAGPDVRSGARVGGARPDGRAGTAGRNRAHTPPRLGSREARGRGRLSRPVLVLTGVVGLVAVAVAAVLLSTSGGGTHDEVGAPVSGAVTPGGGSSASGSAPRPSATTPATASQPPEKAWETVLAGLDAARGRAFEQANESALADVYEVGSAVYAADLALLRQVASQGGHVSGLSLRVLDLQIREQTQDRAVLRVTDQLDAYEILDASGKVLLRKEQAAPERHDVTLVRTTAGWRISQRVTAA
ncbi:serine/threonine protein kinase [Pseudofrankia sp. BMG5.37]|uniref:serine/threonine protein kinase n=1 Tax=Pseudofrankia sp. BMG5.37 TaxID=3050035 RepID=UPI002894AECE|nr:serine/threonine protein kinase [Pseudofrankia sp. BMG5.37]MDT3446130.1 serine/threonine protein kinase [Pseudofrankia sp. BMG5.37]